MMSSCRDRATQRDLSQIIVTAERECERGWPGEIANIHVKICMRHGYWFMLYDSDTHERVNMCMY